MPPRHRKFSISAIIVILSFALPACPGVGLDLTLNGRQTAVLTPDVLAAHARTDPSNGLLTLPLSALFPWLESVDYLEAQSGSNRVYWESPRLGSEGWNGVELVRSEGSWEIRVGRDIFIEPDRIAVRGKRVEIPTIRIWSGIDDAVFEQELNGALSFRELQLEWRRVKRPAQLLTDPPAEGLPHLILLDDLDLMRSASLLTTYRTVSAVSSQWLTRSSGELPSGELSWPLALDAYAAETALNWLLAGNSDLFDTQGRLSNALVGLLKFAARETERVINTGDPMRALSSGRAGTALRAAGEAPENPATLPTYRVIPPPRGTVNVLRNRYAAVPRMLSVPESQVGELLLADAIRFHRPNGDPGALPLPVDPRILRFFEAYERIGRLAVSDQMDASEAVELINAYVNEE